MAITKEPQEFKFKIEAYTPTTMPLSRLTEYLKDLIEIFGEDKSTHLIRIEESSCAPVFLVDPEAVPKVEHRFQEIEQNTAPANVLSAVEKINRKLRMDGTNAAMVGPSGDNVIYFPGAERESLEYALNQPGTLDGVPIVVGGTKDYVPVHLEGRGGKQYICTAHRDIAKEIAKFIFTTVVRVEGVGRWLRNAEGEWELQSFKVGTFKALAKLSDISLSESLEEMRQIPAKWKELEDPIGDLTRLRDDVEM
jgi:hypothetical protein